MKFFTLILLLLSVSFQALASDLSVTIEHPAKGKRLAYKSVVKCSKSCAWEQKKKSGFSERAVFEKDLKALHALVQAGEIPGKKIEFAEDVLVNVSVKENDKETAFTLGLATQYTDTDFERFTKIQALLTRIEFLIQKQGAKK